MVLLQKLKSWIIHLSLGHADLSGRYKSKATKSEKGNRSPVFIYGTIKSKDEGAV